MKPDRKEVFNKFSTVDTTLWLEPGRIIESWCVKIRTVESSWPHCDLNELHWATSPEFSGP